MNAASRFLPIFVVFPVVAYLAIAAIPPTDPPGTPRLHEFAKLPVMEEGRIKPLDSSARVNLMLISKIQTFKDGDKTGQPAIRWLLDSILGNADKYEVFRIEHPELRSTLELEDKPQFNRYSVEEIAPKFQELSRLFGQARDLKGDLDPFNRNVVTLYNNLILYNLIGQQFSPPKLLMIPPATPGEEWLSISQAVKESQAGMPQNVATLAYRDMLAAYSKGDATAFNGALAKYQSYMRDTYPAETRKAAFETFYNNYEPFMKCIYLYIFMFLLAIISWIAFTDELNGVVFWLGVSTLVFHSAAIVARMYLQGRPPITNLYSTAIFIGWAGTLTTLIIEAIYKNGIGNLVASILGSLTCLIAHNLATDGDTMPALQAVLDTNFWLATHVTIINFGYAATFVAGILGVLFVTAGVFTKRLDRSLFVALGQITYGAVCFATLLSFTGTVLGGLWADYSWGRFWGWDPKENGALLIVLWNSLILHARWGGIAKQRGVAVLAILGNIVVAWSWFGVNMLNVGLHTYGPMESGRLMWLVAFACSQVVLACVGLLPTHLWRSFGTTPPVPKLA